MRGTLRLWSAAALFAAVGAIAIGCGGGGDDSSGSGGTSAASGSPAQGKGGSINVAIVDNPQMKDIAKLTPSLFTSRTCAIPSMKKSIASCSRRKTT